MLKRFLPSDHVKNIYCVTPESLKEKGIRGIITDLDNTLVEWDRPDATEELLSWFRNMREHGIKVTIVSNNKETRVKAFSDPLGTPYIYRARKPLARSFKRAALDMGLAREEVVVIGDQLLTDILGGNKAGFYTILVVPVAQSDAWTTKFNRSVERRIMAWFKRKGLLKWEDEE